MNTGLRGVELTDAAAGWPVCGKCCEVAYFSWMGGPHDCEQSSEDDERLQVVLPEPQPMPNNCGNAWRGRLNQVVIVEGVQLTHLVRFFERVHDDPGVSSLRIVVRAGTLQLYGGPGMYSAEVGSSEAD